MPSLRSRLVTPISVLFVFSLGSAHLSDAQITQLVGIPAHTVQIPVPMGFVSATTGQLHLEIPLHSTPQRNGEPIVEKWVYDSSAGVSDVSVGNSYGGSGYASGYSETCTAAGFPGYPFGTVSFLNVFGFQDINLTKHQTANANNYTKSVSCQNNQGVYYGSGADITSTSGIAADGSGYTFQVTNYNQLKVYSADGTLVYDSTSDKQATEYPVDHNGNFSGYAWGLSPECQTTQQCGSQPNTSRSVSGSSYSFDDSSGSPRSYALTYTSLPWASLVNGVQNTGNRSVITSISLQDGTQYTFAYDSGTSGNHNLALLTMTLPTGGTVGFSYVPVPPSGFPFDTYWVSSITYGGGTWNLSYSQNASSSPVTTTLTSPPRYDYASKSNVSDTTIFQTVNYGTIYPFLQSAKYYSGSSTLLKTISVTYDSNGNYMPQTITTTLNDTGFSSSVSLQYYNMIRDALTQIQETDFTGSVVRTTVYTPSTIFPTSVNVYAGTGSGSPIASTLYTYDEYSANYCKNGVPMLTTFTGAYGHDDTYGNSGNATTIKRLISGSTYATTHNCYDTLGNVTQTVDANGNPTTFNYTDTWADSYCIPAGTITHAYPTTITDALGHQRKTSYFSCNIKPQSTKNQNDINAARAGTSFTYDIFDRVVSLSDAAGGSTTTSYSPSIPPSSTTSAVVTSSLTETSTTLQDTYGRAYETELTSDPDGTTYAVKTFDALGRVSQTYNPTRCTTPTSNCGESSWGFSTTTYDALGRVTSITAPDGGVTTTTYSGPCATTTDPAGKARKICNDAFGRIVQVFEDPAGLNYETDYSYDVLGNLTCAAQKGTNSGTFSNCPLLPASWRPRSFSYDGLSRLISATTPESGITNYSYDANGNLISKTSPAPNQTGTATVTVSYCYDALNRVTAKTYTYSPNTPPACSGTPPTFPSPVATYLYDQSGYNGINIANGVGQRTGMTDPSGTEAWSYDAMGRVNLDQRTSGGVTRSISYAHNPDGSVASLIYPSGHSIAYTYGTGGKTAARPITAVDIPNSINFASAGHYSPTGGLAGLLQSSGISSTIVYGSRLQPCWIYATTGTALSWNTTACTATATAGSILDIKYGFNPGTTNNGNVTSVTNNRDTTRSQNFTYDSLNRIATAQTTSTYSTSPTNCWAESYAVDAWGNLLNNAANPSTQSAYNGCSVEAPSNLTGIVATNNRLSGTGFTTDSAGNLAVNGSTGFSYDAENHLLSVTQNGQSVASYTYDGDGRRIAKVGTKLYWYGVEPNAIEETDTVGDRIQHHVFLGNQRVATAVAGVQNPGFEAGSYDWSLSNAQIITDPTRAHSGNNYAQLSATAGTSQALIIQSGWIRVHPGQVISSFGGWVYAESGAAGNMGWVLMVADANYNAVGYVSLNNPPLGAWTQQTGSNLNVGSNGYYARMYCQIWQPTTSTTVRCDDGFLSVDGVTYYAEDMLGTSRVVTDNTGAICYDADFYPYGGERPVTNSCAPNYRFTGKERDAESGLDNFGARYHASSLGRFMSADPFTVTPGRVIDPQQLNLYAYVRNNPLKHIDPTGMLIDDAACKQDQKHCGKDWQKVQDIANQKDKNGNYTHPELQKILSSLQSDSRTFVIENSKLGAGTAGLFTITNFTADGKDFTRATLQLDFKQIKGISGVTGADLVPGFNKYQGLLDSPMYRLAETFGHEGAHGLFSIQNPGEAVGIQQLLNQRDAAMQGQHYPYPPDVMQKMQQADQGLIPTERFAQQEEKIINGELQADKKKQ